MKSLVTLLAVSLAAAASLRADTPSTTQWIVTSAKATGAGGELFVSSLRIVNPNAFAANVDLTFLPASPLDASGSALGDNSAATKVTVTVPAGQTLAIDDVLATKFTATGAGGIKVDSLGTGADGKPLPVTVLSQTLVTNARAADGRPGTNGFAIPAQVPDQLISLGDTGYIPYISSAPDGATTGYRTNLFMLSTLKTGNTVVHIKLTKGDGTILGEKDYTLGKWSQTQINRIAAAFGYQASDTNLTAYVTVKSGGPVAVGASIIDNAISSQSYAPPAKVFAPNNGSFGLILNDGGFDFTGRLDIVGGQADELTAGFVMDNCPASPGPTIQLFFFQSFGNGVTTTFTKNADGSYTVSGSSSTASLSGTAFPAADGTVYGNLTYTRAAGAAGGSCPGVSKTFPFTGARGQILGP